MIRILRPLRQRPIALLWGGLSLSAIGDQLYAVALSWLAVELLGPAAGYLSAFQALVLLLATLGIGRWADGWELRRSLVVADLGRASVLLAVVVWWAWRGAASLPGLVAAVIVLAVGQAVFRPALQAVLPALVEDHAMLPAANGLLDATERSARLLGPGMVALFAGVLPVMHFLSVDAATFLLSAGAVLLIGPIRHGLPRLAGRTSMRQAFARGVQAMEGQPLLRTIWRAAGLLNGTWYAAYYLAVPLVLQQRGAGLGAFGAVISAYGCTNLLGTLVFGNRTLPPRPAPQMFGGLLLSGLGTALLGAAALLPDRWLLPGLMGAAALGAFGGPMGDIPKAVLMQTRLAADAVAPAARAYMASVSLGTLVALLLAPSVLPRLGPVPVLVLCGAAFWCVGVPAWLRHAEWSDLTPAAPPRTSAPG